MSKLPRGWQFVSLGEIGTVQSGVGFPNEHQGLNSGDYPVYKVGDVSRGVTQNNGKLQNAKNYVSTETANLLKGQIFDAGSTLFAKIGEALKLNRRGYVIRPGLADNNVMGYKSLPGVDDRFIYYFLRTQDFAEYSRSTTVPSIRKGDIEEINIALPPTAEQTRIAAKLDELLAQVDTLKARIDGIPALLKRFRQSVLAAAVSGRLTDEWRSTHGVGSNWDRTALDSVCRAAFDGPFGSKLKSDDYTSEGVRVVRLENIGHLNFIAEKNTFISLEKFKELSKNKLAPGDILFSSFVDEEIRVCQLPESGEVFINKADCFCLRIDKTAASPVFVMYALAARRTYRQIREAVHGATRPRINLGFLKSFEISLPSLEEQTEIVRRVEQLFAFADQLEARLKAAQARIDRLTQSILAKAFRGELVPQDPNDEPASVLLERIKAQRAAAPKAKRGRRAAALS
ncbi:restriction endonuclease subunit S [Stutzerimonas sp. KH-1]|jgi:type I restriction enzyme S subunit